MCAAGPGRLPCQTLLRMTATQGAIVAGQRPRRYRLRLLACDPDEKFAAFELDAVQFL